MEFYEQEALLTISVFPSLDFGCARIVRLVLAAGLTQFSWLARPVAALHSPVGDQGSLLLSLVLRVE